MVKYKRVIIILTLLFTSFYIINAYSQEKTTSSNLKKYNIKSGIIEYSMKGITTGKETIYFDDWGDKEATYSESETKMMGMTSKTKTLTIIDGEWVYNIDMDKETGVRAKNMMYENNKNNNDKEGQNQNLKSSNDQMMKDMGGEKIGQEMILGKMCDIWEIKKMGTKTWVWNGISLKNSTNIAGFKMDLIATKLLENAKVPANKFRVPDDVKITESKVIEGNKN
jgi:hypothetical protein